MEERAKPKEKAGKMTVFEKVMEPALPILKKIEAERPKHGNETLAWLDFVRILIYYFTKRCGSQTSLVVSLENADPALKLPKVAQMTLSDAFTRFSPVYLRQAVGVTLAGLALAGQPELSLLGQICACDGSFFPVIGGLKLPEKGDVANRVKLHLIFSLNLMVPVDFLLTEPEGSERDALRQMFQADITYVLDRGYFAFNLYRDIIDAQAHVVMRVYNNIVVVTVETLPVELPAHVAGIWLKVSDRIVRSENDEAIGLEFRLVELLIGSVRYKLLTNRRDLTTFQVILLFAYRWQIELIFRYLKHTMNGVKVISTSRWGMENFFLGMFLTALLHLYFKVDCLEHGGHLPPADPAPPSETTSSQSRRSTDRTRPTAHLAVARFMSALNRVLILFWKIPKHWLETLSDLLHRHFSSDIVDVLNKRAFAALPPS